MSRELREVSDNKQCRHKLDHKLQPRRKCNGVVWRAITISLNSKNLPLQNWQDVLPDVLHSVWSLLCTASNETPHECFFGFSRRSSSGTSIPTWLATPRPVYIKRQACTSKMEPLVDKVELLQVNPHYAQVSYPDGREMTLAI